MVSTTLSNKASTRKAGVIFMKRNSNFKNLTNMTFGYLTALYVDEDKVNKHKGNIYWFCQCVCGKTRSLQTAQLTTGKVTSCGCKNPRTLKSKIISNRKRMYSIYNSMVARCTNPKSISYKYYGAKGITVCDEWKNSFNSFALWAEDNGYDDTLSIDRIDNFKGYSPSNCRWIPLYKQFENTTKSVKYTHNGQTHNLKEWCTILDFDYTLAKSRRKMAKKNKIDPTFEYVFAPKKWKK